MGPVKKPKTDAGWRSVNSYHVLDGVVDSEKNDTNLRMKWRRNKQKQKFSKIIVKNKISHPLFKTEVGASKENEEDKKTGWPKEGLNRA